MTAEVRLTLISSVDGAQHHTFTEPTVCTIGRGDDCTIVVPPSVFSGDVSRHHCEVRIGFNPVRATSRDLESLNGTFVNDVKIGQRFQPVDKPTARPGQFIMLKDGDELRLGKGTAFRVEIHERSEVFAEEVDSTVTPGGFVDAFASLLKGWRRKGEV